MLALPFTIIFTIVVVAGGSSLAQPGQEVKSCALVSLHHLRTRDSERVISESEGDGLLTMQRTEASAGAAHRNNTAYPKAGQAAADLVGVDVSESQPGAGSAKAISTGTDVQTTVVAASAESVITAAPVTEAPVTGMVGTEAPAPTAAATETPVTGMVATEGPTPEVTEEAAMTAVPTAAESVTSAPAADQTDVTTAGETEAPAATVGAAEVPANAAATGAPPTPGTGASATATTNTLTARPIVTEAAATTASEPKSKVSESAAANGTVPPLTMDVNSLPEKMQHHHGQTMTADWREERALPTVPPSTESPVSESGALCSMKVSGPIVVVVAGLTRLFAN